MTEQINNSNNHLWEGRGGGPAGRWAHSTLAGPAICMAPTLLTPCPRQHLMWAGPGTVCSWARLVLAARWGHL